MPQSIGAERHDITASAQPHGHFLVTYSSSGVGFQRPAQGLQHPAQGLQHPAQGLSGQGF
eukprot:281757-Chlamydomonas_euryale.AAC.1